MKKTIFIVSVLFFLSCSTNNSNLGETSLKNKTEQKDSIENTLKFNDCFVEPDTSFSQIAIGCSGGYFKQINDQYVLKILPKINIEYNNCQVLKIDSSEQLIEAQLYIFNKGEASLKNICTDEIEANIPKPIQILNKCYGSITLGKTDPTDYYGNEMPKMTFKINHLTFTNPKGKEINIENELLWKILNTGTPG